MTEPLANDVAAATIQPVGELFTSDVTALWATTYSVDLSLFNEFLFARLGEPPLNVTVLADHRRLASSLERIPAERADTLATVNRRWLLRGVGVGGLFHPKSYLAVSSRRAKLLVGSGNLSGSGLDEGREVFTAFQSGTPIGDAAILAWTHWMRRLLGMLGDTALAERFQDLERRLPKQETITITAPSPLLDNLGSPLVGQLAAAIDSAGERVEELWLATPFYDADAGAVGAMLDGLRPRAVRLFITESTSVDGGKLADRLNASSARVVVDRYDPDRFVHAKLIGIIGGRQSWLLSGSPNLSGQALMRTPGTGGNIELAVLAPLDASAVRAVFLPPGMTADEGDLASLANLTFRGEIDPEPWSVRLGSAAALTDGRIGIVTDPPAGDGWLLSDLTDSQPLDAEGLGRAVTTGPLHGRLVQLVDASGKELSNRAVVDDPVALAAILTTGGTRPAADRPPELTPGDIDTQLGRGLQWIHRTFVMAVSERTPGATDGTDAQDGAGDANDDELWDRLEREQLARDPRASAYERMWQRGKLGDSDPIMELLDMLGSRFPADPGTARRSLLHHLINQPPLKPDDEEEQPTRRWKLSARIRVRARNLLRRWAAAQTDPRLMWVDPFAPAGNFAAIVGFLAHLRLDQARSPERVELTSDDLDDLWQQWLRALAGTGEGNGWLDQLDENDRNSARDRIPEWLPEAAAALSWLVVRPGTELRTRVVAFQPTLAAGLRQGLIDPTEMTARYLSAVTGGSITQGQVDDQLLSALEFIDDPLWCTRTATELGLSRLNLQAPPGAARIQIRLDVLGVVDPLLDARMPRLVAAVRTYRHRDGVALFGTDTGWRIAFVTGEAIAYRPGPHADSTDSAAPLAEGDLEALAAAGGTLASFFPLAGVAAA